MIVKIYTYILVIVSIVVFLIFVITPLIKSGRKFIRESMGKTENYLIEIISDIENGQPHWIVSVKYILHVIIAILLGLFVGVLWPALAIMFILSVISYIRED